MRYSVFTINLLSTCFMGFCCKSMTMKLGVDGIIPCYMLLYTVQSPKYILNNHHMKLSSCN